MIVHSLKANVSRRNYSRDKCETHLIHTKPAQPLWWSEQPIMFSKADHLVHIPDPGSYPLVVEPTIEGTLLSGTLKKDFDLKRITVCDEPFFGIVLGKAAYPWVGCHFL
jgi:hypothetical protein